MEALRPNEERAKTTILFLYISILIDVIAFASDYLQYNLLTNAANGISIGMDEANSNDLRQRLVSFVNLAIIIVSGIVFIRWFRRAYFNLHQKVDYLLYSEGWASGAWFVPIISLYKPFQIMRELYEETDKILTNKIGGYTERTNRVVLVVWWTLWILNSVIGSSVLTRIFDATTIDGLISGTVTHMVTSFIGLPLGFLTIHLVKNYSAMEILLFDLKEEVIEGPSNEDPAPVSVS